MARDFDSISTIAELAHYKETSRGWFDGSVYFEVVTPLEECKVGDIHESSIYVQIFKHGPSHISVRRSDNVVGKVDIVNGCHSVSCTHESTLLGDYTLEEFKNTEYWNMVREAWNDGEIVDIPPKLILDEHLKDDYVILTVQNETMYEDWLGNTRIGYGFDKYEVCVGADEIRLTSKDDEICCTIEELIQAYKTCEKLSFLTLDIKDNVMTCKFNLDDIPEDMEDE